MKNKTKEIAKAFIAAVKADLAQATNEADYEKIRQIVVNTIDEMPDEIVAVDYFTRADIYDFVGDDEADNSELINKVMRRVNKVGLKIDYPTACETIADSVALAK